MDGNPRCTWKKMQVFLKVQLLFHMQLLYARCPSQLRCMSGCFDFQHPFSGHRVHMFVYFKEML